MKITPDPIMTTMKFDERDTIHRIMVNDEKVFDFDLSQRWFVSKVSVSRDRNALVIMLERSEDGEA